MRVVFRCDPAMLDCLARPTLARHALPEWQGAAPRAAFSETRAPLDFAPGLGVGGAGPGNGEGAIVAGAVASKLRALQGKARVSPIGA